MELDDAVFNPLDPGQLLRESAAAASRAALQDPLPTPLPPPPMLDNHNARLFRRASSTSSNSSLLVDDLLHQIYNHQDDDSDDSSSVTRSPTKRADPLRRKGTEISNAIIVTIRYINRSFDIMRIDIRFRELSWFYSSRHRASYRITYAADEIGVTNPG